MAVMMGFMMLLIKIMGHEEPEDIVFVFVLIMDLVMTHQVTNLQYRIDDVAGQCKCQQIKHQVSNEPFFHGEAQR